VPRETQVKSREPITPECNELLRTGQEAPSSAPFATGEWGVNRETESIGIETIALDRIEADDETQWQVRFLV
jgi:hypothetical protein